MFFNEELNSIEIYGQINEEVENSPELIDRINKLVDFLDNLSDDAKVSAGDVMGYICGYFGKNDMPEDEIEVFE